MHTSWKFAVAVSLLASQLFAGALRLTIASPAGNQEAQAKNAAILAQSTACHESQKTTVIATAIGLVGGKQENIPLKVLSLSTPGVFAVAREWPQKGSWVVKLVATNPEYKNYATGALVPVNGDTVDWTAAHQYFHEPKAEEIAGLLAAGDLTASRH